MPSRMHPSWPSWGSSWLSWVHLGAKLRNLAPSWLQLGASWCQLGSNLAHLGVNLAPTSPEISLHLAPWGHLGPGSRQKEPRISILNDFGPFPDPFLKDFNPFKHRFWIRFSSCRFMFSRTSSRKLGTVAALRAQRIGYLYT